MISNNHPLMRSLIRHNVPHLWCDNVLFWHHMDMSSPPAASMHAWINKGARQVAFTQSSDAGGKNVYDERLKQVSNVKQNRNGFGCQIEPARKNEFTNGRTWSGATTRGGVALATDTQQRPDGSGLATKVTGISGAGVDDIYQGFYNKFTPSAKIALSWWMKKISASGVMVVATPSMTGVWTLDFAAIGDGWEWINQNHPAVTVSTPFAGGGVGDNDSGVYWYKSSGPTSLGFYFDLIQLEEGAYPTSPIATAGTAVTRTADAMRLINADVFGRMSEKGSILWVGELPYKPSEIASDAYLLGLNDGDVTTDCLSFNVDATGNQIDVEYESSGGNDGAVNGATLGDVAAGTPIALCAAWSGNDLRYYANGVSEGQDTSLVPSTALDRLEIGGRISTDGRVGGKNFVILCFDRALTERECIRLTQNPEVWKWGA